MLALIVRKFKLKSEQLYLSLVGLCATLLTVWINRRVPIPKISGSYAATSDASTIQGFAMAFGVEKIAETLVFVGFSLALFCLFRMSLNKILSFLAVFIFMTNAQVVLVYLSAPFWDFSTAIIPLLTVTGTVSLLYMRTTNWVLPKTTKKLVASSIICINFFVLLLYTRVYNLMAMRSTAILISSFSVLFVFFIFSGFTKRLYKSGVDGNLTNISDRLFLIPVFLTLLLMRPVLGRGRSPIGDVVFVVGLIFLVFSESKLKLLYKGFFVIVVLFFSKLLQHGPPFAFYVSTGWQSAPRLVSGVTSSPITFGLPFADQTIWLGYLGNAKIPLGQVLNSIYLNSTLLVEYIRINWILISQGIWRFSEAPIGLESYDFFKFRQIIFSPLRYVSAPLLIFSLTILWRRNRMVASFVVSLGFLLMLSAAITRPQFHQLWCLQIFGLWGSMYGLRNGAAVLRNLYLDNNFEISFAAFCQKFLKLPFLILKMNWRKHKHKLLLSRYLLLPAIPTLFFLVATITMAQLQRVQITNLVKFYEIQNWKSVIAAESRSFYNLDSDTNLLKISTGKNCSLSGLRVQYPNFDYDGIQFSEHYNSKFFVGNSSARLVYIPFFTSNIRLPMVSVAGIDAICHLRIEQTHVKVGNLPLIGVLSMQKSMIVPASDIFAEGGSAESRTELSEILKSPIVINGYLPTGGYQAVGDEQDHDLLNRQVSDRIVGRTREGYKSIDVWQESLKIQGGMTRVRLNGELTRGVVMFGWYFDDKEIGGVREPQFDYQISGSIFEVSKRSLNLCLQVRSQTDLGEMVKIKLFLSLITDTYSPSITNLKINSIIVDNGICKNSLTIQNFMPTL